MPVDEGHVRAHAVGDDVHHPAGHVVDHAGALEDAGEDGGGEDHAGDVEDVVGVGGQAGLLVRDVREVHGERERSADQEQHRDRQPLHDHRGEQGEREQGVEPVELGTQGGPVRVEDLEALRVAGLVLVLGVGAGAGAAGDLVRGGGTGTRGTGTGADQDRLGLLDLLLDQDVVQGEHAQPLALALAEHVREDEDAQQSDGQGRDHRDEDVAGVELQRGGGAGRRAAPGQGVHHAVGHGGDTGHDDQAHLQALVQRVHRRHGDHEGGRAVAVEGDDRGEDRRTDDDPHRVGLRELQDSADDRVEEADVDHHAEVDDREHEHRRGGGEAGDAVDDVVTELGALPDEDAEQCRDQYERRDRRHLLQHDQDQEGRDHGEAEDGQHEWIPNVRP
ncbi:hypothetical protein QFZ22_007848 [Streptomyces canus]|uniref:Uncharacterized protein n=1 Tax=Streptomyces canus TaxID=58343 RepID=A0AAW8FPM3_9ACTN|nr:hypothetical protein [Streptomyces canus]